MKRWNFEQDAAGRCVIQHNALPRFRAYWTSGAVQEDAAPLEPFWCDSGSAAGDDCLHLYGITWLDTPPDHPVLERLMHETIGAIDAWIIQRL
jgi:hypothetical protein